MPPAYAHSRPPRSPATESGVYQLPEVPTGALWRTLDTVLCDSISERAIRVTMRRPARDSALDKVAASVVRARHALSTLTARAESPAVSEHLARDRRAVRAIMSAYRLCAELSNELLAIEGLGLDDNRERLEAAGFLPRALRTFDQVILPQFDALEQDGHLDADEETRAFMWDMGAVRLAITRALSALIAVS